MGMVGFLSQVHAAPAGGEAARPAPAADPAPAARPGAPAPATGTPAAGPGGPAAAPAPGAPAGAAPTPSAPEAPKANQSYAVKLRQLAERVSTLKELVSQTKIRLNLLKESVLGTTTAGAELAIVQDNRMGSSFRLVAYRYLLDNKQLDAKSDLSGKPSEKGVTNIYAGPAMDGVHILTVEYVFRGHGFGVFSYLRGYKYRIRSSFRFKIVPGTGTTIRVVPFERGSAFTPLKQRLSIRYEKQVSTLTLKRNVTGARRAADPDEEPMRRPQHAFAVLLFALTLASPASAGARRSLNKIDQNLRTIEGQLAYYLTTIRPPKRTMSARDLQKRLIDGMVLHRMKDYSRAAIVLMDIVNRHPGTTAANEAAFFLADSMFQQREFVVARSNFQKVVSSGSSNQYYQLALQRLLELEMRRAAVLGRAQTADPQRMAQVAELLRKIEAIPAGYRQPSVDYVRGKYLFFRGRVADALKVFSGLGKSHPYHLQAVYFIGVCHIKAGRLNAAAATYKRLVNEVILGRLKLKNATQRRVLQLIILAGARLAYVRGRTADIENAIELYNAIPRKSPFFDDALYERAWAYLKAKRYDRAAQALQLLNVANPNYEKADESKVLLGNLKIRTKDFRHAKAIFRQAASALRPVVRKLRGLKSSAIDPKAIFDQLTTENLEKFDIKIRLPKLALRWL